MAISSARRHAGLLANRREFLRLGCRAVTGLGAAGALGQFGGINALAQTANSGYKALVCIFLFGGSDANDMLIPTDDAGYAAYAGVRRAIAIPRTNLLQATNAGSSTYGLPPSMPGLQTLFQTGKAAVVSNVGMLVRPLTRAQYRANQQPVPSNLFSHSDQQQQWQSAIPIGIAQSGWAGRIADQIRPLNQPSLFPAAVSVNGNSLFLVGQQTQPSQIASPNIAVTGQQNRPGDLERLNALQQILTLSSGVTLVQAAGSRINDSLVVLRQANDAFANLPSLTTPFPTTSIGNQLRQIVRLIQIRGAVGLQRQIFFCSQGGYDTHEDQPNRQPQLLADLSAAMLAFNLAMEELGLSEQVTLFTESEFSRTFQPNASNGTDHAWGGHQFVTGGAVKSGFYGTYPSMVLNGADDSGSRGNWIPSISLDQYGATLAKWFGVPESGLTTVFPNLSNFPTADLGFFKT
jgi:uncharacterized protein (DUF1501 family)